MILQDELFHEGTKYHSGRYPYGSGERPFQHDPNFHHRVNSMLAEGMTLAEIANYYKLSSVNELKTLKSISYNEEKAAQRAKAYDLYMQGVGPTEGARRMGLLDANGKPMESSFRALLGDAPKQNQLRTERTIDILKRTADEHLYVDVGKGVENELGVTESRKKTALKKLELEGYHIYPYSVPIESGKSVDMMILCPPGVTKEEMKKNIAKIAIVGERVPEHVDGKNRYGMTEIQNISSDRVQVRYAEDGGADKDGVIEIRRGVEGLDLGRSKYAQVRIGVDGDRYLKGMAIYADDLPDGVDIRFNTNKTKDVPKLETMKKQKLDDPNNPFGSAISDQRGYLNIVREEGEWATWQKALSSQFLSKQPVQLAKDQLKYRRQNRELEHEQILALENPVLRKHLLTQYADACDNEARHLKAAAMSRQANKVILPLTTIKQDQVYIPPSAGFKDGETVILVRHPHGGKFEIPELRVTTRNKEGRSIYGDAIDAIGIHPKVAAKLSGADFDGDTVLVIPNNDKRIKTQPSLPELHPDRFDPHIQYKGYKGMAKLEGQALQTEMGKVSNLISDMTIKGAPSSDIAKAVKYSMVVIDAEKHELDYKTAKNDCEISDLQKIYQPANPETGKKRAGGASTIISRANSDAYIDEVQRWKTNPITGEKVPIYSGRTKSKYTPETGWVKTDEKRTQKVAKMDLTSDAYTLTSGGSKDNPGTKMEGVYAEHANSMKNLANTARLEALNTVTPKKNPEVAKKYQSEVESLNRKLDESMKHLPYERKARVLANDTVRELKRDNPYIVEDKDALKKAKNMALSHARESLGGGRPKIHITAKEWEAIQAGAVSPTRQWEIFKHCDQDELKQLAMPKSGVKMTPAKIALAKSRLKNNRYTLAEVAADLGVSVSTLEKALG